MPQEIVMTLVNDCECIETGECTCDEMCASGETPLCECACDNCEDEYVACGCGGNCSCQDNNSDWG